MNDREAQVEHYLNHRSYRLMARLTDTHRVGDLRRVEGRVYQVGMVSELRMRLDPVQGTAHQLLTKTFTTYGDPISTSPRALLEPVTRASLTEELRARADRLREKAEKAMATAAAAPSKPASKVAGPVVPAGKNPAEKARLAALAEKKAAVGSKTAASPVPVKTKSLHPCKCGCGEQVAGYFAQGHDARFKGWLLKIERGQMKITDLPVNIQQAYKWVKKGIGAVPTMNYKGEPHRMPEHPEVLGYDAEPTLAKAAEAASSKTAAAPVGKAGPRTIPGKKVAAPPVDEDEDEEESEE